MSLKQDQNYKVLNFSDNHMYMSYFGAEWIRSNDPSSIVIILTIDPCRDDDGLKQNKQRGERNHTK